MSQTTDTDAGNLEEMRLAFQRLSRHSFEAFAPLPIVEGQGVVPHDPPPLPSYRLRYLSASTSERISNIYLFNFLPIEAFRNRDRLSLKTPLFLERLRSIAADDQASGRSVGLSVVTNIHGYTVDELGACVMPALRAAVDQAKLRPQFLGIANPDSYIDREPKVTSDALRSFLATYEEGVGIDLSSERPLVERVHAERHLACGVSRLGKNLYEPIYRVARAHDEILAEFQSLLARDPKEQELERFLTAHYQDILGPQYDRVETQLWLRIPDSIIKDRRVDMFLRNAVSNDWELFEIKRLVRLTGTYRDMPVLASEVHNAIQQVRYYNAILRKDKVRTTFANEGIEYFEPRLHLVIGRTPSIPHAEWRYLLANNQEVNILTYDDLLKQTNLRYDQICRIVQSDASQM